MYTRREFLTQMAAAGIAAESQMHDAEVSSERVVAGKKQNMKTYQVAHANLTVSRIAYGTATLGLEPDYADERSFKESYTRGSAGPMAPDAITKGLKIINTAYEHGITLFDLAHTYGGGKAEILFGEVMKMSPGLRNNITIQSKCGADSKGLNSSYEHIVSATEESLRRLRTDYIDILLLHAHDHLVEPDEVARAFDILNRGGRVRYFGVSNHTIHQIELLKNSVEQPLVVNQIKLGLASCCPIAGSLVDARYADFSGIVDYCRASGMLVQAYSPLKGEYVWGRTLIDPADDAPLEFKQAAVLLADIAKKYSATPAQVMLAWLLRHPAGVVPITGATKPAHIIENCSADRLEINRQDWYALLEAAVKFQRRPS
ncbi:aldo/keto reductase [Steroidobacter agaridevorans]|uniref:aldo/keto reductase n=1 Tax=Steroidobacter agaridevorans TaxID=2695856 RepID=UPI001323BB36|nr:aldo/keto reductase [Steroidobacter agaridevorans]GFE91889.1 hypothetical protein GCM10011488_68430 [Steroidobacter agaridevorans]